MMAGRKSSAPSALRAGAPPASAESPDRQLRHRLREGLERLGLVLDESKQDRLIKYLALLVQWNAVYNLTAVRDPFDMLALHVLDSLSIVDLVGESDGLDVLDVGTGAGLPGIPLAIALPRHTVHMVDAVAKKISFLQQVKSLVDLANIRVEHVRIEALTLPKKPSVIVSRAYADMSRMIRSIEHLADASTTVIAMKGVEPNDELAALPQSWKLVELRRLDVPFVGAHRCAVILKRAR